MGADLRGCHRLVSQSRHLLLASKSYDKGMVQPPEGCLDIRVSKGEIQRALLLMDAIIRGFERLGHRVRVAGEGRGETVVEALGSGVSFVIREYWAMKEHLSKPVSYVRNRKSFGEKKKRKVGRERRYV